MRLTTKFLIAVAVALVFTGTVLAIILISWFRAGITEQIVVNQSEETVQTLDKIDRFLDERNHDIQSLAGRLQLQRYLEDTNNRDDESTVLINGQLTDYINVTGHWDALTLVDLQRKAIVSNVGTSASQQELFDSDELKTLFAKSNGGQSVYSDAMQIKNEEAAMIFITPVRASSAGRPIIGALVGQLSWSDILDILRTVNTTRAFLIDNNGVDIGNNLTDNQADLFEKAYTESAAYQRAKAGKENIVDSATQPSLEPPYSSSLSTFAHQKGFGLYNGSKWLLILETPANQAFVSVGRLVRNVIALVGVCVLLVISVLIIAFRRIFIRPIHTLGQGIAAITTGHLYTRIERKTNDELGDLTDSFNNMAHNLQSAYRGLERQTFMTETNRARLIASVNGLRQGFIIINKDYTVELLNKTVAQSFNLEGKGAQLPIEVVLGKLGKNADQLIKAVKDCVVTGRTQEFQNISFDQRIIQIFMAPVGDKHSTIGAVILIEDKTEEQILQRSKDEFFSIASHELRTPLTAIRGNAALILEYFSDQIKDPNLKEMVDDIHESSVRLISIVNDFLDASRLEQGKMRFKYDAVHLDKIIEGVIYELAGVSREKNLYIKFENKIIGSLPPVYGDKNRLKQVVYNLTGNALKFTEVGGITIWAETIGKNLKIFVQDTGNGIPAPQQQALFRKFEQTSSSNYTRDTTRGSGLGLYISKLIMENMGGTVALEYSEVGKGSCFSFTVPLMSEVSDSHTPVSLTSADSTTALSTATAESLPLTSAKSDVNIASVMDSDVLQS